MDDAAPPPRPKRAASLAHSGRALAILDGAAAAGGALERARRRGADAAATMPMDRRPTVARARARTLRHVELPSAGARSRCRAQHAGAGSDDRRHPSRCCWRAPAALARRSACGRSPTWRSARRAIADRRRGSARRRSRRARPVPGRVQRSGGPAPRGAAHPAAVHGRRVARAADAGVRGPDGRRGHAQPRPSRRSAITARRSRSSAGSRGGSAGWSRTCWCSRAPTPAAIRCSRSISISTR